MRKRLADIKSKGTVKTYVFLRDASERALNRARENQFWFYDCMTVNLYSAFCFEAYLNHLGKINVPDLESIQRSGPELKLNRISNRINHKIDFKTPPFKSFKEIKEYRDTLVHAETIRFKFEGEGYFDFAVDMPEMELTDWEKKTTPETAEKFFEDTGQMIKELHKAAGLKEDPFLDSFIYSWEAKPKE